MKGGKKRGEEAEPCAVRWPFNPVTGGRTKSPRWQGVAFEGEEQMMAPPRLSLSLCQRRGTGRKRAAARRGAASAGESGGARGGRGDRAAVL